MHRRARSTAAALTCAAAALLLSGCTIDNASGDGHAPGPTATSTAAPDGAARVAERYRRAGGLEDVYGIRRDEGPEGVPLVVVWTHNRDDGNAAFEELERSVIGYLQREEGLSPEEGYLLDVYEPDGSLQHRLDARP